jgi:hypothetical protein
MTEHHIGELNEQIAAHRTLMRELALGGQDVRDHERILQLMIEAQTLAMMHRHLLLKELSKPAKHAVRAAGQAVLRDRVFRSDP